MKGEVRRVAGANRKIGLLVLRMWKKTVTWQPKGKCKESSTKKKRVSEINVEEDLAFTFPSEWQLPYV